MSAKKSGGYRDVKFPNPLPGKYKCPVCKFALRDPLQTYCGHRICATCISTTEGARYVVGCYYRNAAYVILLNLHKLDVRYHLLFVLAPVGGLKPVYKHEDLSV